MELLREIMGEDFIPVYTESKFWPKLKNMFFTMLRPYNILTLGLAALILAWLFIVPHGLADNGDFFRIIHNRGLSYINDSESYFEYFVKDYHLTKWFVENKVSFVSTHGLVIELSILLNRIFMPETRYDIRFLAFIYSVFYLIASRILLRAIYDYSGRFFSRFGKRAAKITRWALCLLYVFMFGDMAYLLYFNSFFGEPLTFTMMLLLTAFFIKLLESEKGGQRLLWLIAFALAGVMLTGAKQQNAPVGLLIAAITLRFLIFSKQRMWRSWVAASAIAITLAGVVTYVAISDEIEYINEYHSMTLGVARYADKPERIAELGVDPQMEILKDTIVYDRYPVVLFTSPLLYERLYDNISPLKIGLYYLRHPGLLLNQLESVAKSGFAIRAEMVGNFLKSSGKPPLAKTYVFSAYSFIKPYIIPRSIGFLITFCVALLLGGAYLYYLFIKSGNKRGRIIIEFAVMVGLIAAVQAMVAVLGAGDADLGKHLFLFNVSFDFLLWCFISGIMFTTRLVMTKDKEIPVEEEIDSNVEAQEHEVLTLNA